MKAISTLLTISKVNVNENLIKLTKYKCGNYIQFPIASSDFFLNHYNLLQFYIVLEVDSKLRFP